MSQHDLHNVNFEVFVSGERKLGVATIDLSELNYMASDVSGAGIAGEVSYPVLGHFEDLSVTLHWRVINERPLKLMKHKTVILSCRGAMQNYDAANGLYKVLPVRVDCRAHPKGLNLGSFEVGEQTETESSFMVDYIKITVDGKTIFEFDKFNFKYVVDGEDFLADVRDALGL